MPFIIFQDFRFHLARCRPFDPGRHPFCTRRPLFPHPSRALRLAGHPRSGRFSIATGVSVRPSGALDPYIMTGIVTGPATDHLCPSLLFPFYVGAGRLKACAPSVGVRGWVQTSSAVHPGRICDSIHADHSVMRSAPAAVGSGFWCVGSVRVGMNETAGRRPPASTSQPPAAPLPRRPASPLLRYPAYPLPHHPLLPATPLLRYSATPLPRRPAARHTLPRRPATRWSLSPPSGLPQDVPGGHVSPDGRWRYTATPGLPRDPTTRSLERSLRRAGERHSAGPSQLDAALSDCESWRICSTRAACRNVRWHFY